MKYLLTAALAIVMIACTTEQAPAPTEQGVAKAAHPCYDALVASLSEVKDCAELKSLHPDCSACDYAGENSYRDAVTAWDAACTALECPWCVYASPFDCN